MNAYIKFLTAARSLASQGMTKEEILDFARLQFGKIGTQGLFRKQIDNIFKPSKPVGKKDEVFDSTVEKMQFDDAGKPFNPRNPLKKADGGRIGYAMGSEGIMQMASVDDPFYRQDSRNELSLEIFGKELKLLTPEEMDMLDEEAERLMQKFSSAPDAMDERNQVMENIAINKFGKPLKDLSEDEIIQIDEMMDEMTEKPNREAPSIKLADGGITRIGLKDGVLKRGLKSITGSDTYKTLEDRGFNTAVLMSEGFDQIYNLLSSVPFADGGRAAFKDGPKDPRRRGFMKAAVGVASMLPFGIGKGVKMAAPVVAKAAEISGPALAKIVDTVMSLGKTISQSGRRLKELTTKKKHKGIEVEEDNLDGSYIIKKGDKEIYYKPGRMDETGGIEDDIIEVIEDTITKKAGGGIARMLGE